MGKGVMQKTTIPPELDELGEQIGGFIEHWGFKRVHGKLWTMLFLSEEALNAKTLMERLGISKSLTSMTLNELLKLGVVLEVGKSSKGSMLYTANDNVSQMIVNVLRAREKKMISRIYAAYRLLDALPEESMNNEVPFDRKKLKTLGKTIRNAEKTLNGFIALKSVNLTPWRSLANEKKELQ